MIKKYFDQLWNWYMSLHCRFCPWHFLIDIQNIIIIANYIGKVSQNLEKQILNIHEHYIQNHASFMYNTEFLNEK